MALYRINFRHIKHRVRFEHAEMARRRPFLQVQCLSSCNSCGRAAHTEQRPYSYNIVSYEFSAFCVMIRNHASVDGRMDVRNDFKK